VPGSLALVIKVSVHVSSLKGDPAVRSLQVSRIPASILSFFLATRSG